MNNSHIKRYAPKARRDFIAAITKQAIKYGISENSIAPMVIKGDLAIIADRPFPASIAKARIALVSRVAQLGFDQTIEQVAYSWFNRLCAIRYMELHDYLGHGRRVLSHPDQPTGYQLLEDCLDVELPGLDQNRVRELKLDGTKDEQLYRELLLAQCHALHQAMPFLFESIDDETELLLPENLTKTDSLIHDLITEIPEDDWQSVEIIGWLYQFYISEKKDQVMGKVVKSEDIPAATQLFTPNWIVKYMVQNSLGAQWLATYPDSPLKAQMEYYIEPAEQTDEVNAQLKAITPDSLNPEELTLIDPACGSGHILVEAYDLFKSIYLERGYRRRDFPQLILEKNLFGLDIDKRAAQLTGFALMMKGREDDRRLFEHKVKLNVMPLQDSTAFTADVVIKGVKLDDFGVKARDLVGLKQLFEHATVLGSLIEVPIELSVKLESLEKLSEMISQDLFISEELKLAIPLVKQAKILSAQYDSVVANPPYMGRKGMNLLVKEFLASYFKVAQNDLFASFIIRSCTLLKSSGLAGFLTRQDWMFTARNQPFRENFLDSCALRSLLHVGPNTFPEMSGEIVQGAGVVFGVGFVPNIATTFINATTPDTAKKLESFKAPSTRINIRQEVFSRLPGRPLAYWAPKGTIDSFDSVSIKTVSISDGQNKTADNEQFVRQLWEVDCRKVGETEKWLPYAKGGGFRKWAGNITDAVNWSPDARAHYRKSSRCRIIPEYLWYRQGVTWSRVASSGTPNGFRVLPSGSTFDMVGSSIFILDDADISTVLGILNTGAAAYLLNMLNPTVDLQVADVRNIPFVVPSVKGSFDDRVSKLVKFAQDDWDAYQISWDFKYLPFLKVSSLEPNLTIESSYARWLDHTLDIIVEMKRLEEENNELCIESFGLKDELAPGVPIEQITLTSNPAYRYGIKITEEERDIRFREDTMQELISYAIGCIMGRYSLDEPGLIYANSSNEGFDANRYTKIPADDDGIVPLTDKEWFADDAANRLVEFISVAWDSQNLEENLSFLAANLSPKKGEGSRDTIRRYLCDKFYKDHMKTYKKRPIYWLFSSGKQKAFQCLVYLHRYNEGTLARMRTEYVIPLTAKLSTHVSKLEKDAEASSSTAEIKKLEKEIAQLHKQQTELSSFDEKLRHYADQRISLDLDDGVKVNYGKFGDLLAEVKAIHGKKADT
ncbi:MAG: putative restriction enzyme [Osedax symbiont Rs1]|nr:MAG: putative restriction enzyme [Osedax symbiont Rs1]